MSDAHWSDYLDVRRDTRVPGAVDVFVQDSPQALT